MGAAAPPCGLGAYSTYEVVFFLLAFFIIGFAELVLLPCLARQSAIAWD